MKILLSAFEFDNRDYDEIRAVYPDARIEYSSALTPEEWDAETHCDCDVLLTEQLPMNLARWKKLKLVQLVSAGTDHIARDHAIWQSSITLCTASGIHGVPMAQFGIGSLLMLVHRRVELLEFQTTRVWPQREKFAGQVLRGQTAGIIGYGSIGREVARLCAALGMRVLALKNDPSKKSDAAFNAWPDCGDHDGEIPAAWFAPDEISQMLPQCDALFVTAPRNASTLDLIEDVELHRMKPTALVIVLSRGGIVNESALATALSDGTIAGVAVDGFLEEPPPRTHPLFSAPNVILTPHMSGVYDSYQNSLLQLFCENLHRLSKGEPLLNVSAITQNPT
jgi:phosphoglycerate dehydrogenase-like enzyme